MWYVSFHGGKKPAINNINIYQDNGKANDPATLFADTTGLDELRGFQFTGSLLYLVNAKQSDSKILIYNQNGSQYTYAGVFASAQASNPGLLHPFSLAFDSSGNVYVSSQDTNVVTGYTPQGTPPTGQLMSVASYLQTQYPNGNFLAGTIVASNYGVLPGVATPAPASVSTPEGQGLAVMLANGKVSNSVRDVVVFEGMLYVADEPGNAVKVYSLPEGEFQGEIAGSGLSAPVHLLVNDSTLYIGSTGNDSVYSCKLPTKFSKGKAEPSVFISNGIKHISGIAFDSSSNFYAAERKSKTILKFDSKGKKPTTFIDDLKDEPEFIVYVKTS